MSLFVAICDDDKAVCGALENTLIEIFTELKVDYEIDVYFDSEIFVEKNVKGKNMLYNIVFLDILFAENSINGIEAGQLIRNNFHDNEVSIVYISSEQAYAMKLFDIRPLHFLIKPLTREAVERVIQTYLRFNDNRQGELVYKIGHDIYKIKTNDIVYVQSIKRKLIIYLKNGNTVSFYGTLKDVYTQQLMKFDFMMVHAAYAVNYDYIDVIKADKIALFGNFLQLPISQRKMKDVRERYYAIMKRRREM